MTYEPRGFVYRLLATDGRTVYIGSTADLRARANQHRQCEWGDRFAEMRHSRQMLLSEARRLESHLIATEQPPLNRIRNPLYFGTDRAQKRATFDSFLATLPVVTVPVRVVDSEPEFRLTAEADYDVILGESA